MGQIVLRAKRGDVDEAARALERLVPVDVLGLRSAAALRLLHQRSRGILDDLMIARFPDSLLLICNAARKAADEAHLRDALSDCCEIEALDSALIALQGPRAESALAPLASNVSSMRFMDARETSIMGAKCIASAPVIRVKTDLKSPFPLPARARSSRLCSRSPMSRRLGSGRAIHCGWKQACALWRRPRRGDDAVENSLSWPFKSPSARWLPRRGLSRRGRDSKPT